MEKLFLENLSFLDNGPYSFGIEAGGCIGLSGRSGIGKSQLLRAVADVIPHGGECFLKGVACSTIPAPEWRRLVAMVPAESFWWFDTVGSHFISAIENEKSMQMLQQLGFSKDVLGWQISRLSTGERQRLSLVRTLITNPEVLLLDEPTASLDKKMVNVVEQMLSERCTRYKMSCIWVSHDLEQLERVADKVFRVETKNLVELVDGELL